MDDPSASDLPSAPEPGGADPTRARAGVALAAVVVFVFAASFAVKALLHHNDDAGPGARAGRGAARERRSRIVSLAPNVTEILFALGLGDVVVGVTRFCDYPPEARTRTTVGGYYDPSYEAIAGLRADLVILLPEHEEQRAYLADLGIATLAVGNRSTAEIVDAILTVGGRCGAEAEAARLVAGIRARLARVAERTRGLPKACVLVSVGRTMGSGTLEDVYVAGEGTLYDEAISLAGGENACRGGGAKYPKLSAEGVLRLNPDVIVDLVTDLEDKGTDEDAILADWRSVPGARAVKESRTHVLTGDYVVVPGPRFVNFIEDLARLLHPGTDWRPEADPRPETEGGRP